jgi:large subunit ribosomal protein L30
MSDTEKPSAERWRFAEVLSSEDAMFALWLIEHGFDGNRAALAQALGGKPGRAPRVIDELVAGGFISDEREAVSLTHQGRKALNKVFGEGLGLNKTVTRGSRLSVRRGEFLRIRQIRSGAGFQQRQQRTLLGLGLRRLNHEVDVKATPEVVGMINKIPHLVRVIAPSRADQKHAEQLSLLDAAGRN